jgi:plastocyanin
MAFAPLRHHSIGGTIVGKVTFKGTPPTMKPIDMTMEPVCAKMHATPVMNEGVVAGPGNSLGDVVVYISAGGPASAAPSSPVVLNQKGCQYIPHVLTLQVGQRLEVRNDDETSHNIHPMSRVNPEWNRSQPPGAPPIEDQYDKPEFIRVKCNVHPWMHAYFAVLNTSHSAVTSNDGTFSLGGLPPGKYTVTAWQERFGTQSQEVTITGNETTKLDFVLKVTEY